MAAAADMVRAAEVGELPARNRRDEHLTGVRVVQRSPRRSRALGIEHGGVAAQPQPPSDGAGKLLALAAGDGLPVFAEQRDLDSVLAVESLSERPRVEGQPGSA